MVSNALLIKKKMLKMNCKYKATIGNKNKRWQRVLEILNIISITEYKLYISALSSVWFTLLFYLPLSNNICSPV